MTGTKAQSLHEWAERAGHGFIRFDYQGHGASGGAWEDCTIGLWRDDALAVIDQATRGPLLLVGSSMGGWIAHLAALARPERVAGIVGIAPAADFTERLIWNRLGEDQRAAMLRDGYLVQPSAYDPAGYRITRRLVEEGREHLILGKPIPIDCPVRLLHGQRDEDVPWQLSLDLARDLSGSDVRVTLVKDGDHRLSRAQDIALLLRTVEELAGGGDASASAVPGTGPGKGDGGPA
ncbi:alpha/beta hydrolase [Indioceanicola profundi]|uniref:alpha/beta hydrolase n=1 Tax=Indioceanicola profundi TaxID=2220096 RepID=UPI00384AB77F